MVLPGYLIFSQCYIFIPPENIKTLRMASSKKSEKMALMMSPFHLKEFFYENKTSPQKFFTKVFLNTV